ncbi:MAG: hypothetical protein ABEJ88_03155 [Halobacterium sp.]
MPSRRGYLAASGGLLVALAGCTGTGDGDATTSTTETTERTTTTTTAGTTSDPIEVPKRLSWGETATVDGTDVTPRAASVQHSAFYLTSPDTVGVLSFGDRQAVFVTVDVVGDTRPAVDDFELVLDERVQAWVEYEAAPTARFYEQGQAYAPDESGGGWIGFDAPASVDVEEPRLRVQFGGETEGSIRWPLPDAAASDLRAPPPAFEVSAFSAPDSVAPGGEIEVSATVENTGDGAGTFRGAFNQRGPTYQVETYAFDLAAGAARDWRTVLTAPESGDVDVTVGFATPGRTFRRTVEVTSG